jgi:hypothetical protein
MPRVSLEVPHHLSPDEAVARLRQKAAAARSAFREHISEFQEEWTDHHAQFSIKVMGMKTTGTVAVEPEKVDVHLELPFAAMFFRGAIEGQVRKELVELLSG